MTPGSIELVRSWWKAVAAHDHDVLVAACDADVVWDLTQFAGGDGAATQHGRDGVRAVLRAGRWRAGETCIASGERVLIDAHDDATSAVIHELDGDRIVRLASITDLWDAQLALTGTDPLAVVEAVWAAWEARDLDRVIACFADDVVFDLSQYEAWGGAPSYLGPTSMVGFLAEWMSWWHGYHQEVIDAEVHGRDVLLSVRHGGDRDGARVEEIGGLIYSVRPDGVMDRWTVFSSPEKARAWLALRQAPAPAQ